MTRGTWWLWLCGCVAVVMDVAVAVAGAVSNVLAVGWLTPSAFELKAVYAHSASDYERTVTRSYAVATAAGPVVTELELLSSSPVWLDTPHLQSDCRWCLIVATVSNPSDVSSVGGGKAAACRCSPTKVLCGVCPAPPVFTWLSLHAFRVDVSGVSTSLL